MNIVFLITGIIAGAVIGWLFASMRIKVARITALEKEKELENRALRAESQLGSFQQYMQEGTQQKDQEIEGLKKELQDGRAIVITLNTELAKTREAGKFIEQKLEEQKVEVEQLRKNFNQEFENIAHRLFKEHSKEFSENSSKNLTEILSPLKDRIQQFEAKVKEAFDTELRDKQSLRTEVKMLFELNKQISEEASNLTKALKGDSKTMGNWGEVLLERILEQSGLEKGTMYKTQVSTTTEEGKRYQPDVIIYLPDKKHIVIDSKVSLLAYEKYTNADSEEDRQKFIKEHLTSVYAHVKNLSSKNYQQFEDFNSPDFVLLFIPIEASFGIAVREDTSLFDYAWQHKIVIVSPSTLLATLLTIQSIWKQDNQNKNALEIAKQGANLYDKFAGFIEDLRKIGNSLNNTQKAYEEAMGKLYTGKGNLVSRVESLKKLGLRPTKSLPEKFTDNGEPDLLFNETEE
ncbi:MAG: DNA recombination protein RmuC [Bacteroidales bacterium]